MVILVSMVQASKQQQNRKSHQFPGCPMIKNDVRSIAAPFSNPDSCLEGLPSGVIKQGLLENGPYIEVIFLSKLSFIWDFPASHV